MAERSAGIIQKLERWGTAAENGSLVILLGAMMILAVGQIVLRIFFSLGFVWADELIKLMVLWVALLASVAAARNNKHLRIDALSHFVPETYARFPRIIVDAFAALMCGILAWQSYRYVQLSIEFEDTVLVDIPAWLAYSVLPLSFSLMAYRFSLSFLGDMIGVFRRDTGQAGGE